MKLSLLLTLLICAGFAGFHRSKSMEMKSAERERAALRELASASGYDPEAGAQGETAVVAGTGASRRDLRAFARELFAMVVDPQATWVSGEKPNPDAWRRWLESMTRFAEMDGAERRTTLDEVRNAPDVGDDVRQGVTGSLILALTDIDPADALKLFDELGESAVGKGAAEVIQGDGARRLAEADPLAAAEWVAAREKAGSPVPDYVKDVMPRSMAETDPELAIRFAVEYDELDPYAARSIGAAANSDELRTTTLAVFREALDSIAGDVQDTASRTESDADPYLVSDPGAGVDRDYLMRQFLRGLASGLVNEGVEAADAWIDGAGLTEAERDAAIDGLLGNITSPGPENWLAWMRDTIPEDKLASKMQILIPSWTENDYNAVADWLNDQPDGAIRDSATQSFATTLSQLEPEAAAQWALTLPEGDGRRNLLQRIYRSWKAHDPAAAEEFAGAQGIGE